MPVTGLQRVRRNLQIASNKISDAKTEKAIYTILSQGAALAAVITPVDTSNLINSQTKPEIRKAAYGWTGRVGYTASYAAAVHSMPGTLKGQPRAHFGQTAAGVKFGGGSETGTYWSPRGEPQFLTKGFEKLKPSIMQLLKAAYAV